MPPAPPFPPADLLNFSHSTMQAAQHSQTASHINHRQPSVPKTTEARSEARLPLQRSPSPHLQAMRLEQLGIQV